MNVKGLYPDPPHLALSLWSRFPERQTFARVCEAVRAAGGSPTCIASVVPRGTQFERAREVSDPETVGTRFDNLVRGDDQDVEVTQAGYLCDDRLIVVERAPGPREEIHPVCAKMYDEVDWKPQDLWDDADYAASAVFNAWLIPLFRDMVARTQALYGLILQEMELPTPSQLLNREPLYGDTYVSRALLAHDPYLLSDLRTIQPAAEEQTWPSGTLLAEYGPLRTDGTTQHLDIEQESARALRIGKAVKHYLDDETAFA